MAWMRLLLRTRVSVVYSELGISAAFTLVMSKAIQHKYLIIITPHIYFKGKVFLKIQLVAIGKSLPLEKILIK